MNSRRQLPSNADETRPAGRVAWIDTGRGVAISLVVLYHAAQWMESPGFDTTRWQQINDALATLRMPLFFTIAGMYAGKWTKATWSQLWEHKLSLFVWVYGVWCIVATVPFMLGLRMQGNGGNYLALYRFLLTDPFRPRFELWFIWALAIFFVAFRILRRAPGSILLPILAIVSATAFSIVDFGNPGWNGLLRYSAFFACGLYARDLLLEVGRSSKRVVLGAVAFSWGGLAVIGATTAANTWPGFYLLTATAGVVTGITVSRLLTRVRWLRRVGQQTLPVYLTHTSLIIVIVFVVQVFVDPSDTTTTVTAILVPSVAAIAMALSRIFFRTVGSRRGSRLLFEQPAWFARLGNSGGARRRLRPASEQGEGQHQELQS